MRDTAAVRAHWNRLAPSYDRREALLERWIAPLRKRLWARVQGRVLEVGAGTGKNFPFHPPGADVMATDLAQQMVVRARARASELRVPVDVREADVQDLPFPPDSFDSAVATFVFCSVPDPVRELARVVRPGGIILLLEHVRIDRPVIGPLMDLLDPLLVRLTGSHVNRRTVENVQRAGLEIRVMEEYGPLGVVKLMEVSRDRGRAHPR